MQNERTDREGTVVLKEIARRFVRVSARSEWNGFRPVSKRNVFRAFLPSYATFHAFNKREPGDRTPINQTETKKGRKLMQYFFDQATSKRLFSFLGRVNA